MRVGHTAELLAVVTDQAGNPVTNAVIILRSDTHQVTLNPGTSVIDQIDKEFIDRVTVVQTGTLIEFPNKDNIRHHVYSFSAAKSFELPLYSGTAADPVLFDKPGVVKIGCNIHDWMIGYIYVTDSPFSAITNDDGITRLEDLEEGVYSASVWHPLMKEKEESTLRELSVSADEAIQIDWKIELKADIRPRRSPVPVGRGY